MTEYAVQVNPTIGGVLYNIRGETAEQFKDTLSFLADNASDIQDALAVLQQAGLANQVASTLPNPTNPGTPPPGSGSLPELPTCPLHGPAKDMAGKTTKAGAPYKYRFYCSDFNCKTFKPQN